MSPAGVQAPLRLPLDRAAAPVGSTGGVALRPYQLDALAAVHAALARGITRPLVALPTGTGKTVVFAELIRQRPGRALVLAHRDELLGQAAEKLRMADPTAEIGLVRAERDQTDAPLVVASVQTLARARRLERLDPRGFRTIVVDEAHHAAAESYQRILRALGAFDADGPLTVGFTATPERADRLGLDSVFEEIVFQRSILEMVQAHYLADIRALQVRTAAEFNTLHTHHGDFAERELEAMLLGTDAPALALAAWRQHAADRTTLLFTPTVRVAEQMALTFAAGGVRAAWLSGETPRDERAALLARLKSGDLQVLANCAVLTEGFDEPRIACVLMARPTKSRALYMQMLGRGTRPYPGKDNLLVLDLVGATTRYDLVTAATLFGMTPKQLRERSVLEAQAAAAREAADLDAAAQAARDALRREVSVQDVDVFRGRPLHWLRAGADFVLGLGDAGTLRLVPVAGGLSWRVQQERRGGGPPTVLKDQLDLGYAQGFAEDYARDSGSTALVDPDAPWRQQAATPKQLAALRRLGLPAAPDVTKGEASDLLGAHFARRG